MQAEQHSERELTPADYLAMLRRHWVLILVLALMGPPIGYGLSRVIPPKYKSQTLVLVQPPSVPNAIVPQVDATGINQRLASMQQQILSRSRLEPIIRQFGLYSNDVDHKSMDELVGRLQLAINVTPVAPMAETGAADLPGFFITVTLDNPRTAQAICSAITSLFIQEDVRVQQEHTEQTTNFLTGQLVEAKQNLDAQDSKLAEFKSRYMGALPDNAEANLNVLAGLTAQLEAASQALARGQQDKTFAESMLTQQLAAIQEAQTGHNPDTLEQQLTAMQTQLTTLEGKYTSDYPDVVKTKNDIAALQKKIAETNSSETPDAPSKPARAGAEPAQVIQWRAQIHDDEQLIAEKTHDQEQIKEQIKVYQSRIQATPVVEEQYKQLTRGYQTALDSYNDLLKKKETSEMSGDLNRQQQGEQFTILDPANLPSAPSFPNRLYFTGGGLAAGLAIGIGLTLLFELQDTSLKSERDVEFLLRLPVLGMIPAVEPQMTKKSPGGNAMNTVGSDPILSMRA